MEKEIDYEFEFGCITPISPSSDPNKTVSPADQFFLNGRLLPHSFPIQSTKSSATSSRASSIGSSLRSSRSNSTGSNISGTTSCSSARTSASDASERKSFHKKLARERILYGSHSSPASAHQSWRLISPAPVLDTRRRSGAELGTKSKLQSSKMKKVCGERLGFCQRVLNSFVMGCRACHAMEGAVLERDDYGRHLEFK